MAAAKDKTAKTVTITRAKGRPMLSWVGKRALPRIDAYPAQLMEIFAPLPASESINRPEDWSEWPNEFPRGGLLLQGDNKEALAHLLASGFRGKVNLVYIDPPFDSGADYVRKVSLRGVTGATELDGEPYSLGEQIQYTDIWANDNYLQFMYERFILLKELLATNGSIVVHCDWNVVHMLRCVLDEVFLAQNFVNEVIWQHAVIGAGRGIYRRLPKAHETLLWYVKNDEYAFNTDEKQVRVPYKPRITENLTQDENGYYYTRGRTGTDNPWSKDPRYLKTYVDIEKGKLVHDVWDDMTTYRAQGDEYVGYRTQKPEQLIARVVALSSNPGDLILDCFIGSGTTAAVAQKLGRRWIGCDLNKGAIHTTVKRLQTIIEDQINARTLVDTEEEKVLPAQYTFSTWRVNDYDLHLPHAEAVNLIQKHIGFERTRSDAFFDGTLGKKLVKVIPIDHPLSPLDLESVKMELDARPTEDRTIVLVCLGQELAADAWLTDWNRLRRGKGNINALEVIDLRTDATYGGFIAHKPAKAKVTIRRVKGKKRLDPARIKIQIDDFISPSIVQRLDMDLPLFKAKITDWRSMVDCVMIDKAYDGKVFNVALTDIPERKDDFVMGDYDFEAPDDETTVAVKIVDMLGEEVIVTKKV